MGKQLGTPGIRDNWDLVSPVIDDALAELYSTMFGIRRMASILEGRDIEVLKSTQKAHWKQVFTDGFDAKYKKRIKRIGLTHARIGLDPELFCFSYGVLIQCLIKQFKKINRFKQKKTVEAMEVIIDAIFRDLYFGITTYREILGQNGDNAQKSASAIISHASDRMHKFDGEIRAILSSVDALDDSASEIATSVDQTSDRTEKANERALKVATSMKELDKASAAVHSLLAMITDIADQTKILSLNAMIESSRGGAAAKGIGVVADEVRALAGRTDTTAKQMAKKLVEIQKAANGLHTLVQDVSDSFSGVLEANVEISNQMHKQKCETAQISQRMAQMKQEVTSQLSDLDRLQEEGVRAKVA